MRHTESLAEKSGKFAPLLASWTQDMEAEGLRSDHDRWVLPSQLVRRQPRENFGDPKKDGRMVQKFYTRDVQKKKKHHKLQTLKWLALAGVLNSSTGSM